MKKSKPRRLLRRAERFYAWGFQKEARELLFRMARDYVIDIDIDEEAKGE